MLPGRVREIPFGSQGFRGEVRRPDQVACEGGREHVSYRTVPARGPLAMVLSPIGTAECRRISSGELRLAMDRKE